MTGVPLVAEPGASFSFWVEPRVDPRTGELFAPGFNQVFVDPASGQELGKREWGAAWPVNRENVVSFLYKPHYSLHLPEMWGIDRWGMWLLGGIALIWTVDCFTGFALTLPPPRRKRALAARHQHPPAASGFWPRWKPAWMVRWRSSPYKLNFDLHRG